MLRKSLILKIFDGFSIQRWNDKIRPVRLTEIDKNAHKMVIAYCLAKYEEIKRPNKVIWSNIIKGGIFELLRRVIISDIKSPIYRKIRTNYKREFKALNKWVLRKLDPCIEDDKLKTDLKSYLLEENSLDELSERILSAAHIYSSFWEFKIIKQNNPYGYQIQEIDKLINHEIEEYLDLVGMKKIIGKRPIADFIELVGQLRFQVRWSQTPRIPATSVLGHSMMVACLSYLFSRKLNACKKRVYNNFFGGLFHDLPEAVTRDIISPVKGATPEMPKIIENIERELAEKEIFPLLEKEWHDEIKYFTNDFEKSRISMGRRIKIVTSEEINKKYNKDEYNPIDGEIIKASDHLAAFVEAHTSKEAGIGTKNLEDGMQELKKKYENYKIAGINFGSIYADF